MAFFRLLSKTPLWLLHGTGWLLGWLVFLLSPSYRRNFIANTRQAGYRFAEIAAAVGNTGRMVMEIPRLWLRPAGKPIADPVHWENVELIEEKLASGQGLILLTPHIGCFEILAQAYAERFGARWPMTALYRPARKKFLRELEETARARPGLLTAPANVNGVRQMLRALKRGQCAGILPDQVPPAGLGVWAPFFGRSAYTMTLVSRLLRISGTEPLILWGERLSWGRGYVLHVQPMVIALPEGEDEIADAQAINASMEAVIRQKPDQYLWSYDRYKQPRRE
jgi:KDO2-lipid IV(A) lauroyltransferase